METRRITIVRSDNTVVIDGKAHPVDCSALSEGICVVQWDGELGHIEYAQGGGLPFMTNVDIASLDGFGLEAVAGIIAAWDAAEAAEAVIPELTSAAAKQQILGAIAAVEQAALGSYSAGEQATWPTQLAEAAAFRGISVQELLAGATGAAGTDLTLAPFLTGTCAAEHGEASAEDRLDQVNSLALAVIANAIALAQLSQALIGIRRRAFAATDAAADAAGRETAVAAAMGEIGGLGA